jgi:hypothetical protein
MSEKTAVQMEDGRIVEFTAKQKLIKSTEVDGSFGAVQFDFRNGKTIKYIPAKAMLLQLAVHGASQKIGDECSGLEEVDDCVLAVENMIARLDKGEWSKERTTSGMAGTSVLTRALVESSGKPVETIKAFLLDKTHAQKLALRNNPKIKVIVDRLEAEKNAKKPAVDIDTDALLGELV